MGATGLSTSGTSPWDALRRHHRPHAHWYATHVLGLDAGTDCDDLIDAAFDLASRRLGARRRRPAEVPALPVVREQLQLAIRHEVWIRQHRLRWSLRRLLTGRTRRVHPVEPVTLVAARPSP